MIIHIASCVKYTSSLVSSNPPPPPRAPASLVSSFSSFQTELITFMRLSPSYLYLFCVLCTGIWISQTHKKRNSATAAKLCFWCWPPFQAPAQLKIFKVYLFCNKSRLSSVTVSKGHLALLGIPTFHLPFQGVCEQIAILMLMDDCWYKEK